MIRRLAVPAISLVLTAAGCASGGLLAGDPLRSAPSSSVPASAAPSGSTDPLQTCKGAERALGRLIEIQAEAFQPDQRKEFVSQLKRSKAAFLRQAQQSAEPDLADAYRDLAAAIDAVLAKDQPEAVGPERQALDLAIGRLMSLCEPYARNEKRVGGEG